MVLFRTRGRRRLAFRVGAFPPRIHKHRGLTWLACIRLLSLILLPISAFPQATGTTPISTTDDLFSELLSVKTEEQPKTEALLKDHKNLITPYLWIKLISEAARLSSVANAARALFVLDIARNAAEQLNNKRLLAHTFYRIGATHLAENDYKGALDAYLLSQKTFEEANSPRDLIPVLSEIGELHTFTEDYEKAEEYSEKSLALADSLRSSKEPTGFLPDRYGIATAWSNLGQVRMWKGDYDNAVANFQRSLTNWEDLNQGGSLYKSHIANALIYLGIAFQRIGDYVQSLNHLNKASEIAKALADKDKLATAFANIGLVYWRGDRIYRRTAGRGVTGRAFSSAATEDL